MSALILMLALLAAPPTATPRPTYTPYPTYTAVPTATQTVPPSPTPSPSPSPTPVVHSGSGGTPGSPCKAGEFGIGFPVFGTACIPIGDLLSSIFQGLAGLLTGALGAVISPFNAILTVTPDVTNWPDARSIFNDMWGVGVAMYGTFIVFAALHHYRRMVWGGEHGAPLVMLSDAVVGALFVGGLPWIIATWISLVNDLSTSINGFVGTIGLGALQKLFSDALALLTDDPLLVIVDALLGLLMLLFTLLVGLLRLVGIYAELWLYLIAPLAAGCWVYPPTRPMAQRWAASFASLTLWGSGFALALKAIILVALDLAHSDSAFGNPLVEALTAVAGMVFLFGVPRFVDALIGSVTAAVSGSYVLAEGVIAGGVTATGGQLRALAKAKNVGKGTP